MFVSGNNRRRPSGRLSQQNRRPEATAESLEPRRLLSTAAPVLSAAGVSSQQIDLQWTFGNGVAADLVVERSQGDNPFVPVATLSSSTTSYADSNLLAVTSYRYELRQDNTDGTGAYSNMVTASTLPAQEVTTVIPQLPPHFVEGSSNPTAFVKINGLEYFFAVGGDNLDALWRTDGTAAGTTLLYELGAPDFERPTDLPAAVLNGITYLEVGGNIMRTDGTPQGTVLAPVSQFNYDAQGLVAYHGALYTVNDANNLLVWDGTSTTAQTIATVPYANPSQLRNMTVVTDRMYFNTYEGLWSSDGTAAGTVAARGLPGTPAYQLPSNLSATQPASSFAQLGSLYYFLAQDQTTGAMSLWQTDGTAAGTQEIEALPASVSNAQGAQVQAASGNLYFVTVDGSQDDIWTSDGTTSGTSILKTFSPLPNFNPAAFGFTSVSGSVFFAEADAPGGWALWKTDGTSGGTSSLGTFSGTFASDPGGPQNMTVLGNHLLFTADDGTHGRELWESDGTPGGTDMLDDINDDYVSQHPTWLTNLDGELYFLSTDSSSYGPSTVSNALWKTDGTAAGTSLVYSGPIIQLYAAAGSIYFVAGTEQSGALTLERTDGTPAGTVPLQTFASTYSIPLLGAIGNFVLFDLPDSIWVTDGTVGGTRKLSAPGVLNASNDDRPPTDYAISDGDLYYIAAKDVSGPYDLWRTDGTDAGTTRLAEFTSPVLYLPTQMAATGDSIVFEMNETIYPWAPQYKLLTWDSSVGAIELLNTFSSLSPPVTFKKFAYFSATLPGGTEQLWRTDGTPNGTSVFLDTVAGAIASSDYLYISTPTVLYRSDGTVTDMIPYPAYQPQNLQIPNNEELGPPWDLSGTLFFANTVLWATDGTALGTRIVDPSSGQLDPSYLFGGQSSLVVGDRLYYVPVQNPPTDPGGLRYVSVAPLTAPTNIRGYPIHQFYPSNLLWADISWSDANTDASGYVIDRSIHPDFSTIDASFYVPAGTYSFTDTSTPRSPTYFYRVRAVDAGGTSPPSSTLKITFASVSGRVINDTNNNGVTDPGESGMSGVTVFLDVNFNGRWDPGEPETVTDANGNYTLLSPTAGTWRVYEVVPTGFAQTTPLGYLTIVGTNDGIVSTAPNFGNVAISSVVMDESYFMIIARDFGHAGTFATGDLNGDGVVNLADLLLCVRNFNHALPSPVFPNHTSEGSPTSTTRRRVG